MELSTQHLQLKSTLELLLAQYQKEISEANTEPLLRTVYARYGGKEGRIRLAVANALRSAIGPDKKAIGQIGNGIFVQMDLLLAEEVKKLAEKERLSDLARRIDVTLPGRPLCLGALHPMTQIRRTIEGIFSELGFTIAMGNQIETDFYNFQALGMPANHPARSAQDTFYIKHEPSSKSGKIEEETKLLRTHTSSVQIRKMLAEPPPLRMIAPGKVYRKEDDPTHSPMFTQLEGLVIDQRITFGDLKGTLLYFVKRLFGENTKIRLRASFFPFVEPGAELDIICYFCQGKGGECRTCKGTGFIEVLGCGLVNPVVFEEVNRKLGKKTYDPDRYTGFAFGMGLDRLAMLKYGVNDLKLFFSGDLRLSEQFR